ncbi:OmpA family protein [Rubrolithibacter danxiaensis]|uniref:OmpA family protein n=1 Tax=Rubrolithibacter danxiaensis TaxID=3390805 RepID=UPI003BF871E3
MKYTLLLVLLFSGGLLFGQNTQSANKQAQKIYEQANQAISYKLYEQAIEHLKKAVSIDPNFSAAWQQLGDIYRKLQNYGEAKKNYLQILQINPEFHPLTYFGLAESELNTGDYENSLKHFTKYLSYSSISESSRKNATKYIEDCKFSLNALKNPVNFNPVNLGQQINSKEQEYLPVVTADEETIIFTRQANRNEDFYKSTRSNNNWTNVRYLSRNINTDTYNEGAQCISPDGMYLFFTGCNRPDGMGRCDIYVCRREGKDWSKPFNIGAPVNTPGWESQPSLSADGRTLYFVSTRPGGIGGYDLWKTELQTDGGWQIPQNLGPEINTPYDEQSPFIHPDDQTLYFSSNGWPGMGNKDLFLSRKDANGKFQKPKNLGYPINTFKEESSLIISSNGSTAFFASDKEGGFGGLDIYSFPLPEKLRPKPVTYVKGIVFDKSTQEVLDAKIQIISLANNKVIFDDSSDFETGEFLATMPLGKTFALNVAKEGYLFYSENFSLTNSTTSTKPFHIKVPLDKIEVGGKVVLRNIFFDTNKFSLLPESKTELQQLLGFLNANPRITIEIGGHTDNVGDDKSNQLLSENRAKTVYNFLVNNKINPSRLTYKGYGEAAPIADNSSEEGRQNNRRTEFRIIKSQ